MIRIQLLENWGNLPRGFLKYTNWIVLYKLNKIVEEDYKTISKKKKNEKGKNRFQFN